MISDQLKQKKPRWRPVGPVSEPTTIEILTYDAFRTLFRERKRCYNSEPELGGLRHLPFQVMFVRDKQKFKNRTFSFDMQTAVLRAVAGHRNSKMETL